MERVRLHKVISSSGMASLRQAEKLISEGRVTLNGEVVTKKGIKVVPSEVKIKVDGRLVKPIKKADFIYLKIYKPKKCITTKKDEKDRVTVIDLLPKKFKNIFPVGRLDYHSEGLLLLTNDGQFANRVISPKNKIKKVYLVKVRNIPDEKILRKTLKGLKIDNEKLKLDSVTIVEKVDNNCWMKVSLKEGRNRQIRKIFKPLGFPVLKLKRIEIGPIKLGSLRSGDLAHLSEKELSLLKKSLTPTSDLKIMPPHSKST